MCTITTDETTSVSISSQSYEVIESVGFVDVVVTKTGDFSQSIQGTLTTLQTGSASGELCISLLYTCFNER